MATFNTSSGVQFRVSYDRPTLPHLKGVLCLVCKVHNYPDDQMITLASGVFLRLFVFPPVYEFNSPK